MRGILAAVDRIEFVRRAVAASWKSQPDWHAMADFYSTDHVMFTRMVALDGGGWHGVEGFRRWLGEVAEGIVWE